MSPSLIPCQRHLFDIPEEVAYLNCAYMSPLMKHVCDAGDTSTRRKARPWTITAPDFFSELEATRGRFARLTGTSADNIAAVPAASYGLALAAANVALAKGQTIVLPAEQFPSNVYTWRELARARGAEIVTVPRPDNDDWSAALLAAIDGDTGIVAASHCHWTNGALFDLAAIGARCREVGAALVLDATQSIGALPLDLAAVQPDVLVAASYKWQLGPYGFGFCYLDPRYHGGRPLEHNWANRQNADDFTNLVDYRDEFQAGARRFDFGQRGNFHLVPMAAAALETLLGWGVENIQATLTAKTDAIAAQAAELGVEAVPRHLRAGHYLGLKFPQGVPPDLGAKLAAEKIYISQRGQGGLRITPHLWVNDNDVERFLRVLKEAL